MKAFGDAVVADKAPHGDDLFRPGIQSLAELDQLRQAGLAQLGDRAQEAGNQLLALFSGFVLFQQQIAEPLLEKT